MHPFLCTALAGSFLLVGISAHSQGFIAITGGTLIDGRGSNPLQDAIVLIKGNRIFKVGLASEHAIPSGSRIISARGKYILPGLIDTHVHLELPGSSDLAELPEGWKGVERARELVAIDAKLDLIAGFTTVRDLGSSEVVLRVRDDISSGKLIGPRIIASGMQLVKHDSLLPPEGSFLEYDGTGSARSAVRRLAAMGAEVIKVRLTRMRPVPSGEEMRVIVEEAHRLGLKVTVHTDVPADDLVKLAIEARADGIEHNAPLRAKDTLTLLQMVRQNMSLMAGAGHFYVQRIDTSGLIDRFDIAQKRLFPAEVLEALEAGMKVLHEQTRQMSQSGWNAATRQAGFVVEVRRARAAGVLLVFGTDCGAYGMVHGEQYKALYGESQMGSTPMEVIQMATRDAARAIGREGELGTVAQGKLADVVIVDADPLADLRNIRRVFRVIKGGSVYDPLELSSAPTH